MNKFFEWLMNLFGGGSGGGGEPTFPKKGVTCLFVPRGQGGGNRTTWDPLQQPNMWKWLKSIKSNCVVMLAIDTGQKRIYTDSEFKDIWSNCKKNGLYPFWTMYVDGAVGSIDPKKWRANWSKDTLKLIQALDRLKIGGDLVFSIEHNEVVSPSEVTSWANEVRKATKRRACSHMQTGVGQSVPAGLDIVFVETNQPDKGNALSVNDLVNKANSSIGAVKKTGAKCMVMEYNEDVGGNHYKAQRDAMSKLDQWGYG